MRPRNLKGWARAKLIPNILASSARATAVSSLPRQADCLADVGGVAVLRADALQAIYSEVEDQIPADNFYIVVAQRSN
jgi:hypothetical protein